MIPAVGGDRRRVTRTLARWEAIPAWSPDGHHIAFAAGPDKEQRYNLFVVDADGGGRRKLTFGDSHDAHPSWGQ